MNQGLIPKIHDSLEGIDLPEEMQLEILEKFENNEFETMNDLLQYLDEHNVPMASIEELFDNFKDEGIALQGEALEFALYDDPISSAEADLLNDLTEDLNRNKSTLDLGQPDLLRQFKPSRPRPSPFDDEM